MKFLLDKLANPHMVFGVESKDACDLAKENGLDKRFWVFAKCNGESKVFPKDPLNYPLLDHRKALAQASSDQQRKPAEDEANA